MLNLESCRKEYVDIAKALGIYLVVCGHVVDANTVTKIVLYSFHMPLFFILSGLLLKSEGPCQWGGYFKKKFKVLMIPCILWGLIYCKLSPKNLLYVFYGSREMLVKAGSLTSLWFIPVMFLALIIIRPILCTKHFKRNHNMGILMTIPLFFTISFLLPHFANTGWLWGFDIALTASGFMLSGYIINIVLKKCSSILLWCFMFLLSTILFVFIVYRYALGYPYVLMAEAQYSLPHWIFLATSFTGSLSIITLSFLISKVQVQKRFLLCIGRNSLAIFLIHKPLIIYARKCVTSCNIDYNCIGVSLLISFGVVIISMMIISLLNKYVPYLFGERKCY